MKQDDNILVERACKGDRAAFQLLIERYYDMMFRVAYRYTGHRQDAEDVAQEICIGLAHKLGSFKGKSSFSTWLYRIIVNACRDMFKHRASVARSEEGFIELESLGIAEQNDSARKIAWLYRNIVHLEESLKETALLVLTEECSHAEAADILGCKESTVSWRMHEVRKHLKSAMDDYND